MIQKIDEVGFPQYYQQLSDAAQNILPCLAFSKNEVEEFVRFCSWRRKKTNVAYLFKNSRSQKVFIGGHGKIQYIIPSCWDDRYTLIKEALRELITEICGDNPNAKFRFAVNESVPSHGMYFIGLLPQLGFELVPRIEMKADPNIIDTLTLPALPQDFEELAYSEEHFDLFANAYKNFAQAADSQSNLRSPQERAQRSKDLEPFQDYYCYQESTQELRKKVWLGILHQDQIVGYCFSDIWDNGKRMIVLELAIDPKFWGQKLGRYLTIRSMQNMKEHYGTPESYFTIGTQRDNIRARTLYEHLGFKRWQVDTRVFYPSQ